MEIARDATAQINREEILRSVGEMSLSPLTLPDQATLTRNLELTGTASRNRKSLFPRLAQHGSSEFDYLADFVLLVHQEVREFTSELGMVNSILEEQRIPRYLNALLKDQDRVIKSSAGTIWYAVVSSLYGTRTPKTAIKGKTAPNLRPCPK